MTDRDDSKPQVHTPRFCFNGFMFLAPPNIPAKVSGNDCHFSQQRLDFERIYPDHIVTTCIPKNT